MYFSIDSQQITPLNRKCELREGVLRHLVLKIHPRLVEPILAHAEGSEAEPEADATEAEPAPTGQPEPAGTSA